MGPSRQQSSQLADGKILNWQCSSLADCVSWTRPRFSTSMNQPHIGGVTQPVFLPWMLILSLIQDMIEDFSSSKVMLQ